MTLGGVERVGIIALLLLSGVLLASGLLFMYTPMGTFESGDVILKRYPYGYSNYTTMDSWESCRVIASSGRIDVSCDRTCYRYYGNTTFLSSISSGSIIQLVKLNVVSITGYKWSLDREKIVEESSFDESEFNATAIVDLFESKFSLIYSLGSTEVVNGEEKGNYFLSHIVQHDESNFILFVSSSANQPYSTLYTIKVITPYGIMAPYIISGGVALMLICLFLFLKIFKVMDHLFSKGFNHQT